MSASTCASADDRGIELGTSLNWPPIFAAAGLGLLVLSGALVLPFVSGMYAAPEQHPAVAQSVDLAAKEKEPASSVLPPLRRPWREAPVPAPSVETGSKPAAPSTPKPKRLVVAAKPTPPPVVVAETRTPPVAETTSAPPVPQPPYKRREFYSEEELFARLQADSHELDVETVKGTTAKLLKEPKKEEPKKATPPILELIAQRDDLKGLPVRKVADCQASEKEAKTIKVFSREVRGVLADSRSRRDTNSFHDILRREECLVAYMKQEYEAKEPKWREDVGVRMLTQMFQPESYPIRLQVVKMLTTSKEKSASVALAQWTVFDLNPAIREAAIKELKQRPSSEYQPVLLEALRYPWAPVADHAAEALVALDGREVVADLVNLLDKPNPLAPTLNKDKKWVVPELARVNHLGNCVVCHAPASAQDDTVRGVVPERGKPLPEAYYESRSGSFVRADVTYLKQDFSVMQSVTNPDKWPRVQRFDYLIRQRELNADEEKRWLQTKEVDLGPTLNYPQRDAVLWALQVLTGHDAGKHSEDWRQYLAAEREKCTP